MTAPVDQRREIVNQQQSMGELLRRVGEMRIIREPIEGGIPEENEFDYTRKGIESVMFIRCLNHRAVPQENSNENHFGECGACIAEAKEGVITAVIAAISGTVEGQPTNRANFLQRVRELVEIEKAARAAVGR